ncbi:hypothetical protein BJY04DRAFT_224901 [Aspergillus karnatakaensis]|uniref:uncharacterized protein n=1 Tax=Aspergillus karnatakaensis TaxID=1810916 RepID=UPI003CCE2EF3
MVMLPIILLSLFFSPLISASIFPEILPSSCKGAGLTCALQLKLGIWPPPSSRRADCSSFQKATITPDPITSTTTVATETITVTTTVTGDVVLRARELEARATTIQPTAVPSYAFGTCRQPGAYASACSCLGITGTTTTAPAPTTFVSVTATTTVTTTVTVAPPEPECPNGGRCNEYDEYFCFDQRICRCAFDTEGNNFCWLSTDGCNDRQACSLNADCPSGQRCLGQSCCSYTGCVQEAAPGGCTGTPLRRRGIPGFMSGVAVGLLRS